VSSTLSDTGPGQAASSEPKPESSAGAAPRRSRPHIVAFDVIRLIIMVFVVSVHTLSFAGGRVTMTIGAVTTIFHTSRELFLLLTALVLTYNYGKRPMKAGRFWRRRFWLVLPAYLTWSAIYYAANGASRGSFPGGYFHDLLDAGARYHLYFLLVSMQIYLLFPLIRWVLAKTERYHAWLFAAALAYQTWITFALHFKYGRNGDGTLAQFINGAGTGDWITAYVLYVVAGALAGWHFEALSAFTRRHLKSGWRVGAVALVGLAAGLGTYFMETLVYGATPGNASAVFDPIVMVEALCFGWALLGFGLLWGDRGAPGRKFAAAGSASSFGIYLAHPLVLQGLLLVMGSYRLFGGHGGLTGWLHRLPDSLEVLPLLFIAVPLIYACAWVIASAMRRTPVSLLITGREWKPARKFAFGQAADQWLDRAEAFVIAQGSRVPKRVAIVTLAVVVVAGSATAFTSKIITDRDATIDSHTYSLQVGSMKRSYTVMTPGKVRLSASAPIIVVLSGLNSSQYSEITRDEIAPYAAAGDAEVVYPLAYRESWNAVGCCSWAASAHVNDIGFMTSLVSAIDPGHARPIYVVGYSNGGRLAYQLACDDPGLFTGTVIVKADPMPDCIVTAPVKIMSIAATDDTDTPFTPSDPPGRETPPATVQAARLEHDLGCSSTTEKQSAGNMTYTLYPDCAETAEVGWVVYTAGLHSFPRPPASYPAASTVIWSFITGKALAPIPRAAT
jgi:poly(3-hydroxybutyrate) depolymerase/peptidoglycan/LPS O-acetylase OafA/YrhL